MWIRKKNKRRRKKLEQDQIILSTIEKALEIGEQLGYPFVYRSKITDNVFPFKTYVVNSKEELEKELKDALYETGWKIYSDATFMEFYLKKYIPSEKIESIKNVLKFPDVYDFNDEYEINLLTGRCEKTTNHYIELRKLKDLISKELKLQHPAIKQKIS